MTDETNVNPFNATATNLPSIEVTGFAQNQENVDWIPMGHNPSDASDISELVNPNTDSFPRVEVDSLIKDPENIPKPFVEDSILHEESPNDATSIVIDFSQDDGDAKKKKIKNIVLIVGVLAIAGYFLTQTSFFKGKTEVPPTKTAVVVNSGASNGTGTVSVSTGAMFNINETPLWLIYGSGAGTTQLNGNVTIQTNDDQGNIGLAFIFRANYTNLISDTKASIMFKNFKFISSYPTYFGWQMARILAMGKAWYSEKSNSAFFQIDSLIAPDSIAKNYKKTIDAYTAHWAQFPTGSISPKVTMNVFSVIGSVVQSKDDFDNLFSPVEHATGVIGSGVLSTESESGNVVLKFNALTPLKDKINSAGLDPMLGDILFNPDTKTVVTLNKETGHINLSVTFPSSLYFKWATNSGTGTLVIDGIISSTDSSVGTQPTDARVWGSEYIDTISNSSTFEPLETTVNTRTTSSTVSSTTSVDDGTPKVFSSGAKVPSLPPWKNEPNWLANE